MNMETVTIKRMESKDADAVVAIEAEVYGAHHWSKDSFLQELNNDLAYYYSLFTPDGKLAGYAGSWHILDEAHITNIAVAKEFQHRKYGEALLKKMIDDCYSEKVKYITLEVRVSNKPAIGLYSKYGFQSFGTRKKYYQDNDEDALIMWTKNIFYNEFKSNYEKTITELEKVIKVNE